MNVGYLSHHLLFGVILVHIFALFVDKKVPYYPIEISRVAASGYYANLILKTTSATLVANVFVLHEKVSIFIYGMCFSLIVIAFFDDFQYHGIHLLGVVSLALCVILYTLETASFKLCLENGVVLVLIVLIWSGSSFMKYMSVFIFETNEDKSFFFVISKIREIMIQGESACQEPGVTLTFFKLCGVFQWTCFWLMSLLVKWFFFLQVNKKKTMFIRESSEILLIWLLAWWWWVWYRGRFS